jgi:hypothetical protein
MISIITAYRNRASQLNVLLFWLERIRSEEKFSDFEWILVEGSSDPTVHKLISGKPWARYQFVKMDGVFHKSHLLNTGVNISRGDFVVTLDVDLLPARGVLALHTGMARSSPNLLISGYRVLLKEIPNVGQLPSSQDIITRLRSKSTSILGPEDGPSALYKYLVKGERFGVCPFYSRELIIKLGGYDEAYIGWGAEDQDVLEKSCAQGITLVRSYDLLYFHMPHNDEPGWRDRSLTQKNRKRFYNNRKMYCPGGPDES